METKFGGVSDVQAFLDARGSKRPLVVLSRSRRHLDWLEPALAGRDPLLFDGAVVHVPRTVVSAAAAHLEHADAIVSLGGGACTGLGKALKLQRDLPFVAVPTTYAGSEQTNIWGTTGDGEKETGRDDRVRPDLVVYDVSLTIDLGVALSVQSLANAMAHPISALSTGSVHDRGAALRAVRVAYDAARGIVLDPSDPYARRQALEATALAGEVLGSNAMGAHHKRAHALGGRFDLPHAPLHSILLVQTLAGLDAELRREMGRAMGEGDPAASLAELLRRAGAPLSLRQLGLDVDALEGDDPLVRRAALGRVPSVAHRSIDLGGTEVVCEGPPPAEAARVVFALPGRNGTAEGVLEIVRVALGSDPRVLIAAPMPAGGRWYDASYRDVDAETLSPILDQIDGAIEALGAPDVHLFGFSQGACVALALAARTRRKFGSIAAIAGATPPHAAGDYAAVAGVPVLLGLSAGDGWVDAGHLDASADALAAAGARVTRVDDPGAEHAVLPRQRRALREMVMGDLLPAAPTGFGNTLWSEALPGALPMGQNSPRRAPYGLQPEQINNTGFVAPRSLNRRVWVYRARPSAQQRAFTPLDHDGLEGDFGAPPDPNLAGYRPPPLPEPPTDFVDGLQTFGGAGSPQGRRGFAVYLYAANRSMTGRAFAATDGELLFIPQQGELYLQTELGWLDVAPGQIAIVPRGLRFSVHVSGAVRGWVGEVFGRSFQLPERGPVGANGLTEPRHFVGPRASFEDSLSPGYEIVSRHMGRLYRTTQDFSPYDVAAWHGNDVPFVYDLSRFCPVGNVGFDHIDPSAFIVLTTPQDEPGVHTLDLVYFPERTDATRHTFRPPFHHRNAVNELNLVVLQPGNRMFESGTTFFTPSHTPHMVRAHVVERTLGLSDEEADRPARLGGKDLWLQLETGLPLTRTRHAESLRVSHWRARWGEVRRTFDATPGDREPDDDLG